MPTVSMRDLARRTSDVVEGRRQADEELARGETRSLVPAAFTLESAYASVPRLPHELPIDEQLDLTGEEHAEHIVQEMERDRRGEGA